ncbi:MAG: hypothetical protein KAR42_08185 [candidate division Zixibacteria bacterium]|nr:hypothetical protein [candidate division Zixibacteria bacterium]
MNALIRNQNGMALFIALMLTLMLSIIGIGIITTSNDEITIAGNELNEMTAFYAAEAGLEKASAVIQTHFETTNLAPTTLPSGTESLSDATVSYASSDGGAAVMRKLSTGPFMGLNALVKTYTITSTGESQVDKSKIIVSQDFECALVPIFQFAVFYQEMLQASPAYGMTIDGRVHVNGDMWVQGWSGLTFGDKVTCAGDIHHGLQNGAEAGAPGGVYFQDGDGNSVNMNSGGNWLDASDSDWYTDATARWDGNVRDKAFGQGEVNMPIGGSGSPHKIVERDNGGANPDSYENKATLKIIDGVAWHFSGGAWSDVTANLTAAGAMTYNSTTEFTDGHEAKTVLATEIDMAALDASSYAPPNGVIYVSDHRAVTSSEMNGTVLTNGADIGSPLTLVSENPTYVEGDFNNVDKQPAAIISDACTFLSNEWASTNKAKSHLNYNYRSVSSAAEVNVSIITGDLTPTSSNYGGGLENLPRFLEHWSGKEFKFRGSMICLWKSTTADGTYKYKGSPGYYSAPFRNWGFDHDLEDPTKLPPETPQVQYFQRIGWKQDYVGVSRSDMGL